MKQITFADAEYSNKRKQTRKELFLKEMEQVVPWKGMLGLIEPHYPRGEGGRPSYPLMAMLRVHLLQSWFGYSVRPWRKHCMRLRSCASFLAYLVDMSRLLSSVRLVLHLVCRINQRLLKLR